MPEPLDTTAPPRRVLLYAAAVLAVLVIAAVAIISAVGDDDSSPADIVPDDPDEVVETDEDAVPEADDERGPEDEGTLPNPPTPLMIAEAWLDAVVTNDQVAWEGMHGLEVAPPLTLMSRALPDPTDDQAIAAYMGSLAALHAELAIRGGEVDPGSCSLIGERVRCVAMVPETDVSYGVETTLQAVLTVVDGTITEATIGSFATPDGFWSDFERMDPFLTGRERECLVNAYTGEGCVGAATSISDRYAELFRPLVIGLAPELGVAVAWSDLLYADEVAVFRALHAPAATVDGSLFAGVPQGSLSDAAVAEVYFGSYEAMQAALENGHVPGVPEGCEDGGDGVIRCRDGGDRLEGYSGPGQTTTHELTIADGLVQAYRLDVVAADVGDAPSLDAVVAIATPEELACFPSQFTTRECGALWPAFTIRIIEEIGDPAYTPQ